MKNYIIEEDITNPENDILYKTLKKNTCFKFNKNFRNNLKITGHRYDIYIESGKYKGCYYLGYIFENEVDIEFKEKESIKYFSEIFNFNLDLKSINDFLYKYNFLMNYLFGIDCINKISHTEELIKNFRYDGNNYIYEFKEDHLKINFNFKMSSDIHLDYKIKILNCIQFNYNGKEFIGQDLDLFLSYLIEEFACKKINKTKEQLTFKDKKIINLLNYK